MYMGLVDIPRKYFRGDRQRTTMTVAAVLLLAAVVAGQGGTLNPELLSTESTIIVSWTPSPNDTFYLVRHHLSSGWIQTSREFLGPFDGSKLSYGVANLFPGRNYTFYIFRNGNSSADKVFQQMIPTVPLPPTDISSSRQGPDYIEVTWESGYNSSQDSFEITYRASNVNSSGLVTVTVNSGELSYNATNLGPPGMAYVFRMRARFVDKVSNQTQEVALATAPLPPVAVTATALNTTHLSVSWKPSNGSIQTGYRVSSVEYGKAVETWSACTGAALSCVFEPAGVPGTLFEVRVYAISTGNATSQPGTVLYNTEPKQVEPLGGTVGPASINLTWVPAEHSEFEWFLVNVTYVQQGTVSSFNVSRSTGPSIQYSYSVPGLLGGASYSIEVFAVTRTTISNPATKLFYTIPEPVTQLKGFALGTTSLRVTWALPLHTDIKDIVLMLTRPGGERLNKTLGSGDTENTIQSLVPGERYEVGVVVVAPVTQSRVANITLRTRPEAPGITEVMTTSTNVTVRLTAPAQGVYDKIRLVLTGAPNPQTELTQTGLLEHTFAGLSPGRQYVLNVLSLSGQQESENITRRVVTAPLTPADFTSNATSATQILVQWSAVTGGVDGYTVSAVRAGGGSAPLRVNTTGLALNLTDLTPGETYNVSVVANFLSKSSAPATTQTTLSPLPLRHIWQSAKGITHVTISWDVGGGSEIDGFAYDFPFANLSKVLLPVNATSQKFDNLTADTQYTVTLYAYSVNPQGVNLFSPGQTMNFTTYPATVPALAKLGANATTLTLNWTAPLTGLFQFYRLRIWLQQQPNNSAETTLLGNVTSFTFSGLTPGQTYLVGIQTQLSQQLGVQVVVQVVTKPLPVATLNVTTVNSSSVNLQWTVLPVSLQRSFIVTYSDDSGGEGRDLTVDAVQGQTNYSQVLTQLLPGRTYSISVQPKQEIAADKELGDIVNITATTDPRPIENLMAETEGTAVHLTWSPGQDSRQDGYRIRYRPTLRNAAAPATEVNTTQPSADIGPLFPGEKYEIAVVAVSGDRISEPRTITVQVAPLPPAQVTVVPELTTTSSVTVTWLYLLNATFLDGWQLNYTNQSYDESTMIPAAQNRGNYSHTINNLRPGALYTMDLTSISRGQTSLPVSFNATVRPVLSTKLEEPQGQTRNDTLYLTYTVSADEMYEFLRFRLRGEPSILPVERPKSSVDRKVALTGLQGGTLYTVEVTAVSNNVASDPTTINIRTVPNPVPVSYTAKSRSVQVTFLQLQGYADHYQLVCADLSNTVVFSQQYSAQGLVVEIPNLTPFSNYTITVTTTAGDKSARASFRVETTEAAPDQVQNVNVQEIELRKVQVTWEQPSLSNGKLVSFRLAYTGYDASRPSSRDEGERTIPAPAMSYTLEGLKAGYTYNFTVQGVTVERGPPGWKVLTLSTAQPGFLVGESATSAAPRQVASAPVEQSKVSVTFRNAFSEDNGRILYYAVLVAKDPSAMIVGRPRTWQEANSDSSVMAYQTSENCSDFFSPSSSCGSGRSRRQASQGSLQERVFVVGTQTSCQGVEYCNGPLKPETTYYVKLRAYTSGGYTDTAVSQPIKTAAQPTNVAGVVGGVIAALIIVAILAVVAFFIYRRRKPKPAHKYGGSWERASLHKFSRPISVGEFKEHVQRMSADSDLRYAEEFEDLKEVGRDQPCHAAEIPANRPKNRFTNILPYDHSRVKLLPTDDDEGSDYINANYMPGFNSKREYIATQGPLPATRDDFWRMAWEQNARNIVMLTKCMEKGREKSDHYWPTDTEPKFYGDFQVAILNETHLPDYTVSEFRMSLGDTTRQVRHFHYKAWPDFGVPKDPTSLIRFVRVVRDKLIREGGPIITHCSAGVGRSGTFIVLDTCLQKLGSGAAQLDIYSIVHQLRKERVLMVQTETQYKFIHECLQYVIEGRETEALYVNVGHVNVGFDDDEGITVEMPDSSLQFKD